MSSPVSVKITDPYGATNKHNDEAPHIVVTLPTEDQTKKCGPSVSARDRSEDKLGPKDASGSRGQNKG
jgi:hypothetical protein